MRVLFRFVLILFIVVVFTVLTQIGGLLFLLCYVFFRKSTKRLALYFVLSYLLCTFIVVPIIAPYFGREKIKTNDHIKVHLFLTSLANRDYVVPEMNDVLGVASEKVRKSYPAVQIHCLDANFPFWDGFPLLPHLSHNDGKKLDISLIYQDTLGAVVNKKPSRSGYGIFEAPQPAEYDQIAVCKSKGYWQYDFSKHLALGTTDATLVISKPATKKVLQSFLEQQKITKVFIEPHIRTRLNMRHPKLRYHGCKAVRHDDHIHVQIR